MQRKEELKIRGAEDAVAKVGESLMVKASSTSTSKLRFTINDRLQAVYFFKEKALGISSSEHRNVSAFKSSPNCLSDTLPASQGCQLMTLSPWMPTSGQDS
ncbi:hypothetical protein JOB18_020030 [Solea senegalensis]|uniref:Uncharacterized protein n=1 Tax=Solea senegalensis TaxID=28829 RepID=A0AAV6RT37_SOLSE|nr:hypothetical protein JOB18_020030 [Solea senegalensis]